MTKTPCYNCEKREAGCHAICEEYKAWKSAHTERVKANTYAYNEQYNAYLTVRKNKRPKR